MMKSYSIINKFTLRLDYFRKKIRFDFGNIHMRLFDSRESTIKFKNISIVSDGPYEIKRTIDNYKTYNLRKNLLQFHNRDDKWVTQRCANFLESKVRNASGAAGSKLFPHTNLHIFPGLRPLWTLQRSDRARIGNNFR